MEPDGRLVYHWLRKLPRLIVLGTHLFLELGSEPPRVTIGGSSVTLNNGVEYSFPRHPIYEMVIGVYRQRII